MYFGMYAAVLEASVLYHTWFLYTVEYFDILVEWLSIQFDI